MRKIKTTVMALSMLAASVVMPFNLINGNTFLSSAVELSEDKAETAVNTIVKPDLSGNFKKIEAGGNITYSVSPVYDTSGGVTYKGKTIITLDSKTVLKAIKAGDHVESIDLKYNDGTTQSVNVNTSSVGDLVNIPEQNGSKAVTEVVINNGMIIAIANKGPIDGKSKNTDIIVTTDAKATGFAAMAVTSALKGTAADPKSPTEDEINNMSEYVSELDFSVVFVGKDACYNPYGTPKALISAVENSKYTPAVSVNEDGMVELPEMGENERIKAIKLNGMNIGSVDTPLRITVKPNTDAACYVPVAAVSYGGSWEGVINPYITVKTSDNLSLEAVESLKSRSLGDFTTQIDSGDEIFYEIGGGENDAVFIELDPDTSLSNIVLGSFGNLKPSDIEFVVEKKNMEENNASDAAESEEGEDSGKYMGVVRNNEDIVVPGQEIVYTYNNISYNDDASCDNFYATQTFTREIQPVSLKTGKYTGNTPSNYSIIYRLNTDKEEVWRSLGNELAFDNDTDIKFPELSDEYVTAVRFLYGKTEKGFSAEKSPEITVVVSNDIEYEAEIKTSVITNGLKELSVDYTSQAIYGWVEIQAVDIDTNKKIGESTLVVGAVGDEYDISNLDIPGYRFIKSDGDKSGKFTEGLTKTITVYYEKLPKTGEEPYNNWIFYSCALALSSIGACFIIGWLDKKEIK